MTKLLQSTAVVAKLPPMGDVAAMEQRFRQIVLDQPGNAEAHFVLGMLALREGRFEAALESIAGAIKLDPTNADYPLAQGTAYARLGRVDDAEAAFRRALELRPGTVEAFNELGNLLVGRGRLDDAADAFRQSAALRPGLFEPCHNLGTILAQQGRLDDAAAAFEQALRAAPDHPGAARSLASVQGRRGRLDEAAAAYREAVRLLPGDADIRNDLGIILARQGRYTDAAEAYREAIRLKPEYPDAHNNLGNSLRNQGKHDEAITSLQEAIRLRPAYPEAHNNLGIALKHKGKHNEAVACYQEALRQRPAYAEAHNNLGIALADRGQIDGAIACYQQALRLKGDYFECWLNLGNVLGGRNRLGEAEAAYRKAVALRMGDPKAHRLLGVTLARMDKFDEAIVEHREAIRLRPSFHDAHNDLGITLARLNRFEEAAECYRKAAECRPNYAEAISNLGNALRNLGRFEESVECYKQAIAMKPTYADAYNNMGITYAETGRFREAVAAYTECLKIRPNHVDAHMNRALTWLRDGDMARGWAEYEWRWKKRPVSPRPLIQPYWNGFPLQGLRILLVTEQGLGDTMQFIRYAQILKQRGATVIFECPERLMKLLERTPGIDEVVQQGQPLPDYDFHVPLLTIPGLVGTSLETIPAPGPYIHPDPELVEKWRLEFAGIREFKVGINWQGNPKYGGDRHRSIPLERYEPLARVPGVKLYSIQKNAGHEQLKALGDRFPVVDLGPRLDESSNPFMDTAAVMKNLDLFITSDTAVAHLAGSLGVPTWMATSVAAGWQWMTVREDCPWYPAMRLFRQPELMKWEPVFERMAGELASLVPLSARMASLVLQVRPGDLLDRIARLEAEAAPPVETARLDSIRSELAELAATRDRVFAGLGGLLSSPAGDLRSVHLELRRAEDGLRSCERGGDFGPRFVELARSISRAKDKREGLVRQVDALLDPATTGPRPANAPASPSPPKKKSSATLERKNEPNPSSVVVQDEPKSGVAGPNGEPAEGGDPPKTNPIPPFAEPGLCETPSPDRRGGRRRRASTPIVAKAIDGPAISEGAKFPDEPNPD
jgi:tetratricopeptide (TPR) repeat protein